MEWRKGYGKIGMEYISLMYVFKKKKIVGSLVDKVTYYSPDYLPHLTLDIL